MQLRELSHALGAVSTDPLDGIEVTGVSHNTGLLNAGYAYVAIRGARVDGHSFIDKAASAGAVAVIGEGLPEGAECALPYLKVSDARAALAHAAAALNDYPSKRLRVVGITGTDGKTTTSWMTRHLHQAAGLATGMLSTVGYALPDGELRQFPVHFTTPEAPQVQEILHTMVKAGTHTAVLETSSHALAMKRVEAVDFDVAIWTNLSPEHLELHGSMEQYFADKSILVRSARTAVLNADDKYARRLYGIAPEQVTYSASGGEADWRATNVSEHSAHLKFTCVSPLGTFDVDLPMVGQFNVANALAAMAGAALAGATIPQLQEGMRTFAGVPGRLQFIPTPPDCPRVIIDFAHTALSVENILQTLRPTTEGKLWIVLGASGDRDPAKRAPMGEAATRMADIAVFTEDDPRTESVEAIMAQMASGAQGRDNFVLIADRAEAITYAIHSAAPADTVVLAGKGPESFIARGLTEDPWDEEFHASTAIATRGR